MAARIGLPPGLPVAVGAADGPLGNLGTGAIQPGVAGLSLGTSGAVRMAVNEPRFDPAGRLFCYALTDTLWVSGGAVSNGGNTLRWAGETFAPDLVADGPADTELLALAAQIPAGSDGLAMLPYVLSERAPLWDPDIPGAFLGVRHHHTRSHFIRAAVEGVCLQISTIVDALDTVSPVRSVRATGGPFRSSLWQNVMAATLARPFTVQADAGGTALGAAALGWFALGGAPDLTEALAAVRGHESDEVSVPVDSGRHRGLCVTAGQRPRPDRRLRPGGRSVHPESTNAREPRRDHSSRIKGDGINGEHSETGHCWAGRSGLDVCPVHRRRHGAQHGDRGDLRSGSRQGGGRRLDLSRGSVLYRLSDDDGQR